MRIEPLRTVAWKPYDATRRRVNSATLVPSEALVPQAWPTLHQRLLDNKLANEDGPSEQKSFKTIRYMHWSDSVWSQVLGSLEHLFRFIAHCKLEMNTAGVLQAKTSSSDIQMKSSEGIITRSLSPLLSYVNFFSG
jgi:hypothetical protein